MQRLDPNPVEESQRLLALQATGLLDSAPEEAFDQLAALAAAICEVPTGLITLVDERRQWFKARVGEAATERPREHAFCLHAMRQEGVFVVPDAQADPRFVANPLVTGHPHIRFYAAYPLSTSQGYKLGTLCVLDSQPRTLTPLQEQALTVLATQVMTQIEMKMRMKELHATVIENQRMSRELMVSEERFRAFMDASPAAAFIKDEAGRMVYCNHSLTKKFGVNPEDWVGKTDYQIWPKRYARQYREADCQVLKGNNVVHFDDISPSLEGEKMTWSVYKFPFIDASGSKFVAGIAVDVTKERAVKRELRRSQMELQVANRKLRMLALTDPLTDLLNRRGFEEDLETEFAKARRSHIPLSLLMLDIDDFKSFNDRLGHIKGDEVLRKISRILRKCLRRNDIAARYGGGGVYCHSAGHELARGCAYRRAVV